MKHYILNLERRKDRREFMIAKMRDLGIQTYEFVQAVDQRTLLQPPRSAYKRMPWGRCAPAIYKSFVQFCKLALAQNHPHVVYLEDDVYFRQDYVEQLTHHALNGVFQKYDVVYLGYQHYPMRSPELRAEWMAGRPFSLPYDFNFKLCGAFGIVFNRKALEHFSALQLSEKSLAIDRELFERKHRLKLNYLLVHPMLVVPEVRDANNMGTRDMRFYTGRKIDLSRFRMVTDYGRYIKV